MTSARFTWEAPQYKYKINNYEIKISKWNSRPEKPVPTPDSETSFLLSNLESGTDYRVEVRAVTEHNQTGDWSVSTSFVTRGFILFYFLYSSVNQKERFILQRKAAKI